MPNQAQVNISKITVEIEIERNFVTDFSHQPSGTRFNPPPTLQSLRTRGAEDDKIMGILQISLVKRPKLMFQRQHVSCHPVDPMLHCKHVDALLWQSCISGAL
jgi:hypothetical protein